MFAMGEAKSAHSDWHQSQASRKEPTFVLLKQNPGVINMMQYTKYMKYFKLYYLFVLTVCLWVNHGEVFKYLKKLDKTVDVKLFRR